MLSSSRLAEKEPTAPLPHEAPKVSPPRSIWQIVRDGKLEEVKLLIEKGKVDVNAVTKKGTTPLFVAAQFGHIEIVEYLINEAKANVVQTRNDGTTALFIAAEYGHFEVVQFLLSKCKDNINQARNDGATPLDLARNYGHSKIAKLLLANGAKGKKSERKSLGLSMVSYPPMIRSYRTMRALRKWSSPRIGPNIPPAKIIRRGSLTLFDERRVVPPAAIKSRRDSLITSVVDNSGASLGENELAIAAKDWGCSIM